MRKLIVFSLLAACDSGSTAPPVDGNPPGGDLSMMAANDFTMSNGYPAGPYGPNMGDTIPPLVWEGYVDATGDTVATMKPFMPYTMDMLRTMGPRYALVHVAEFY